VPQRDYFEYPVVPADVVAVVVSFFWAQAPKLKAPAKTATIMIAFKNFNLTRLLSLLVAPFV
jgi:hypothetical protein